MTDYYDVTGSPATDSFGDSATIRAEFAAIQTGISEKLPPLSGNGLELVRVNSGATGMESITVAVLAGLLAVSSFTVDDATTNDITNCLTLTHTTTGTPATGIGTGLAFVTETSAGNNETGMVLSAVTTDVTGASEDFDFVIKLMAGGATAAEVARFKSTGAMNIDTINEKTSAAGVTIDGVLLKDSGITATGGGSLTGTWSNMGAVTTIDINGGTIDGAIIGGASAAAGTFTTLAGTTSVVANGDITITSGSIVSASGAISFSNENLSTSGTLASGQLTVTGNIKPNANDGGSLGISGTGFSDIFLASGAVINFAAGNVTLTHSTGSLACSGTWSNLGAVTTVDINGGTIDGTTQATGTINGSIAAGGTWTAAATWTLPAITLGGTVTSNGQSFSGTIANLGTVTTADINGGTIDGSTIGASSASTGAFTTLSATGVVTVSAGSAGAPAITTSGDTDTGIYFPAADVWAVATGGVERLRVSSNGNVGIGTTGVGDTLLKLSVNLTGATTTYGFRSNSQIQSDVTANAIIFNSNPSTAAAVFNVSDLSNFRVDQGTIGAGSSVTNQYGFIVTSAMTGATNNYGFYGQLASGTGRYNLYMVGTANNYLAGNLGIGSTDLPSTQLHIQKTTTGATTSRGVWMNSVIQSDVTVSANLFQTSAQTLASAFTLTNLRHFYATQGTIGAGSTVTNQWGFFADSTLVGATSNYGFLSNLPVSGSANWNFYAQGTAPNYFAGSIGIGTTTLTATGMAIAKAITGSTSGYGVLVTSVAQSDVTSDMTVFRSSPSTVAAAFTLSSLLHFQAQTGTFGAGSAVTNQIGFDVSSNLTGATNNYGFKGNIAAATGCYNLFMSGTAQNYLAGVTGIGIAASSTAMLALAASTTGVSSLRIAHGSAPTSPVDGDVWTTTAGLFARINGTTVQFAIV